MNLDTIRSGLRLFAASLTVGAALFCTGATAGAAEAAARPPIAPFFANPQLKDAALSPSGRYLAAIAGAPGRRDMLAVIDLQTSAIKPVAGYANVDIVEFEWVNDDRLMFSVSDKQIGPGGAFLANGLYAIDRDGSAQRQLAARNGDTGGTVIGSHLRSRILPWHTFMLGQRGAQDSDWAYLESREFDREGTPDPSNLLQVNTRTGEARTLPRPGAVDHWLLDNTGAPRLAVTSEKGISEIQYLDPASGKWRVLASFDSYQGGKDAFTPRGFGNDGTLYVSRHHDTDTSALYRFDLATRKVHPQPVIVTEGYDFSGYLIGRRDRLLGVRILTDASGTVWFDPEMEAIQKKVDALLPGTNNLLSVAAQANAPRVLVYAYSDRQPPVWLLYEIATGKLGKIGDTYADIDPARMARQDPVNYKARDGRNIPGLLTLPKGEGKKLPLVMLVHGGPYVRGNSWGWDSESQFLASRGYAVLEPAYRGSTGFGQAHYRAGWKQWGLAMQDDIADGARWAIAQGIADPKRICIMGASYGGYATLMGLVRDPDLYRCGVNWAGVTDINLLYEGSWGVSSDLHPDYKKYGMPALVGDPVKDAAQLKATSPIEQAARITQPVLLAYGDADRRVPIDHGIKFRDAVKRNNKQVEWIAYRDEGHGWSLPHNRVDFWSRVETFLDRHIGSGAPR